MKCPRCESELDLMASEVLDKMVYLDYICSECMAWVRDKWDGPTLVASTWADMRSKNE